MHGDSESQARNDLRSEDCMFQQHEELLKAPYGGNTADPHFLDALRDCYEQVWTGAAHVALGVHAYEEAMAGCGKSESRLTHFCVLRIWDGSSLHIELLCF